MGQSSKIESFKVQIPSTFIFYMALFLIPSLSLFGRDLQTFISGIGPTKIFEYVVGCALMATAAASVIGKRTGLISWQLLFVSIIIFVFIPYQMERYEERIHFVCFGLLGFSTYRAFDIRAAVMVSGLVGSGDELLQHFLSSRVGDLRDVAMNFFAGLSAATLAYKADK